jgi:hypothetical protein
LVPKGKPTAQGGLVECPHSWSAFIRRDRGPVLAVSPVGRFAPADAPTPSAGSEPTQDDMLEFTSVGATTNVPEYHDCQRLREMKPGATQPEYGALAAVFATEGLAMLSDSALSADRKLVAMVFLPFGGSYAPLKMNGTYHCLFVRAVHGKADSAWMIPVANEAQCATGVPDAMFSEVTRLAAHVAPQPAALGAADIPPVARWDWDPQTRTQFIGVRCGGRWCEIGQRAGFSTSPQYAGIGYPGTARLTSIKGWYDEQHLAEYAPESPGGENVLTIANNLGTFVPHPDLAAWAGAKDAETPDGRWNRVGVVYLRPKVGSYAASFNFFATGAPPGSLGALVEICRGTAAQCSPSAVLQIAATACTPQRGNANRKWYARISRPDGRTKYVCVVYRKHPAGFAMPAVVRWRWDPKDERGWASCPQGCCEVNGDGF